MSAEKFLVEPHQHEHDARDSNETDSKNRPDSMTAASGFRDVTANPERFCLPDYEGQADVDKY